jgi:hypothetical protein
MQGKSNGNFYCYVLRTDNKLYLAHWIVSTLLNYSDNHKHQFLNQNAGVSPYPLIQYPRSQLSAVYRGPTEIKLHKQAVHESKRAPSEKGRNVLKSNWLNAPSTWLNSLVTVPALKRHKPILSYLLQWEIKYTVNVQCSVQYNLFLLYWILVLSYCA